NGRPFTFYKFRSMITDSEPNGPQLSIGEEDPRVTFIGKFLRKSKLDEIPQFWNVLIGDMSLVGPRPERPYFVEMLLTEEPEYEDLFAIKPGITSFGQVEFGYAHNLNDLLERMKMDLPYIESISLKTDLSVLFKTFGIVFYINPKPKKSKVYRTSHQEI
ncbi:MAG: sugar transferase, partial [Proteobacteria bacterium]|nr:sugar transferase [Pseudomonadota bacterium]